MDISHSWCDNDAFISYSLNSKTMRAELGNMGSEVSCALILFTKAPFFV